MTSWDAQQYLKFEDERTRPARDLLARVPLAAPRLVYDLGCGPGNSTELLVARFPQAETIGLDSSPAMLAKAKTALPGTTFIEADLATWMPERPTDLLFANAAFQWLPEHVKVLPGLMNALAPGGSLAVQMPDNMMEATHTLMSDVARELGFADKVRGAARSPLPPPRAYYDLLAPSARTVDIWHTVYNHVLADAAAVVDWVRGTGLRPFLDPLDESERHAYLTTYTKRIAEAYPPTVDGHVLLRFPRLFIVATRA